MKPIIEIRNVTKNYSNMTAVQDVSFSVQEGEVFGILGPNGAGKTTTLEMVEGLKPIDAGSILLDGLDIAAHNQEVKRRIGVQLQSSAFFDGLTLIELLDMFAAMYGREVDARALLAKVQLTEKADSMVKELSGGQKQRFSIATALVNDPKVLFLDEPTTGLDPQARRNLWDLISEINRTGTTIVLTTHYMDEAEVLCDRIAIMDHANLVALDTTENLLKDSRLVSGIQFRTEPALAADAFRELPGVRGASSEDGLIHLASGTVEQTLPALFELARTGNYTILDLQVKQPTLEDLFLTLTGHALRD